MFRRSLARPTLRLALLLATLPAVAQSTPTFTISTSNVTISPTGTVAIPYTLTSVNGYTGTVVLQCQAPVVPAGVSIPYCVVPASATNCNPTTPELLPATTCILKANQVFTGSFSLVGNTAATSAGFIASHNPLLAILFIVALLSGLTLRRHKARRLTVPACLIMLAALCCTTGCGTAPHGFTPGTYTYVVSATQSPVPLYIAAKSTVTVQ